jgi:hypothetical protein
VYHLPRNEIRVALLQEDHEDKAGVGLGQPLHRLPKERVQTIRGNQQGVTQCEAESVEKEKPRSSYEKRPQQTAAPAIWNYGCRSREDAKTAEWALCHLPEENEPFVC